MESIDKFFGREARSTSPWWRTLDDSRGGTETFAYAPVRVARARQSRKCVRPRPSRLCPGRDLELRPVQWDWWEEYSSRSNKESSGRSIPKAPLATGRWNSTLDTFSTPWLECPSQYSAECSRWENLKRRFRCRTCHWRHPCCALRTTLPTTMLMFRVSRSLLDRIGCRRTLI